ncbi:MAG: TraR/DksA C4-type zinc finger protein [Gammaproteobacteria bacterium]|nr:TraR/DksA C4-type zinc finger protein [Gammaproteobacteria bacterium]
MLERFADPIDAASDFTDRLNQSAIERELTQTKTTEKPLMIDGLPCCRDCGNTIPINRLEAKPDAARCTECQCVHDKKKGGYR